MVDGLVKGATIVDLDGTLVSCNTLHEYIATALKHISLPGRVAIMMLLAARKLHIIDHETMKYRALSIAGRDEKMLQDFVARVNGCRRREVDEFLEKRRNQGDTIILASAAAGFYVPYIWKGEMLVSPPGGPDLRGEAKVEAVSAYLKKNNLRLNYFLTDHSDDLPLARFTRQAGGEVLLVKPKEKLRRAFAAEGFSVEL
ncbi:MAG: haloacid dehalogenase-like hydrolase [Muribaculaceae bacterium]|nr:haloacid dehalogenase-like hydrolase [Muribaculaceae bacterium]